MPDPSDGRLLAVAFGPPTMHEALEGLPAISAQADCVELRLDLFDEPFDLPRLMHARGDLPVIVTLRPPDQGGRSALAADERLRVLQRAAELGAEYVDVEFDALTSDRLRALRGAGARVVASRHDLVGMSDLAGWWAELASLGADVVKVVGTARSALDTLAVFRAFRCANRPTIAIAMGDAGLLTRVLALREPRCLLTYASIDPRTGTAPGQVTVAEMRGVYRVERLGPTTAVFGLLGPHAEQGRLAEYNAWFAAADFDGVAVPVLAEPTADAAALITGFRELSMSGWHIHGGPLQAGVLAALDELAPAAARQGKVNSIVRRADGTLAGDWVESPREQYERWVAASG